MAVTSFLAPVPKVHFDSSLDVLRTKDFVLFGSDAFDFFKKVEIGARVLIYLSHDVAEPEVLYEGTYQGIVGDPIQMRTLEAAGFRPSTAVGERFGFYWKASGVKKLPQAIKLSDIKTKSGKYMESFPHGPLAVI